MYAFYSLLVFIFYSLFRRDAAREGEAGEGEAEQSPLPLVPGQGHPQVSAGSSASRAAPGLRPCLPPRRRTSGCPDGAPGAVRRRRCPPRGASARTGAGSRASPATSSLCSACCGKGASGGVWEPAPPGTPAAPTPLRRVPGRGAALELLSAQAAEPAVEARVPVRIWGWGSQRSSAETQRRLVRAERLWRAPGSGGGGSAPLPHSLVAPPSCGSPSCAPSRCSCGGTENGPSPGRKIPPQPRSAACQALGLALGLPEGDRPPACLQLTAKEGPTTFQMESPRRTEKAQCKDPWKELTGVDSSSDSDRGSSTEEEDDEEGFSWGGLGDAPSPLTEFQALKQEAAAKFCLAETESSVEKRLESPLILVMSHLLSFLERYSQMQLLQEKAGEYRSRLRKEESRRRKQLRGLKKAYRQRVKDKLSLIASLEGVICEQQELLEKMREGVKLPSACLLHPVAPAGVHQLVESISALQGERSRLAEEVTGLRQEAEEREREKQRLTGNFQHQVQGLEQQIHEREEELARLRVGTGVTDSEKRIHNLMVENDGLKQSLSITQGLLQQLATVSTRPQCLLTKENEELRTKVQQLEATLQQKVEELMGLEVQMDRLQWRKEEEVRHLDERLRGLQLSLEAQKSQPPEIQYITRAVPVDSPCTLQALAEAEERSRALLEQLAGQAERCRQLTEKLHSSEEAVAGLRHKVSAYESEIAGLRQELLCRIDQLEAQKEEAVQEASKCSKQHLQHLREQLAGVRQHLDTLQPLLRGMKSNYNSLRGQVCSFADCYEAALSEARQQMCSAINKVSHVNHSLQERYQREVLLRKKYHDQLLEVKGNIRVLCRLKPLIKADWKEGEVGTAVGADPTDDGCVTACYKGKERTFKLDKVFLPQATQEEVFQEIEPLVMSCMNGYNVCIFAYGQTGSGKTYTMEGIPDNPGINQQALQALYREMEAKREAWKYSVSLSMVEIYNEVIRDLLAKDPQEKLDVKLNPDGSGQLHVPGLTSVEVHSLHEIKKVLSLGKRNRATQSTNMNERSSRSHALLTITITGTELAAGTKVTGKLNLVDLAGSERVWKSGAQGERLKEAQNINKSLLALGEVIQALRAKQAHVPFRNSKLTYLLQDSLGKGSKTIMMVQISPLEKDMGESICSLKFAQRVCKVELGPASRRIDSCAQRDA
ncbi:kinesin-like protein KIFC2 [Tiliqua scincoides]|uniref:kinesin-like protein KIFC2 n=1 Tax=Tiliqua scincoides TaxID=71010 RepID=UPI0034625D34